MVDWLFIELSKGIGRVFLNMLLYWSILLIILAGYRRIMRERKDFGFKIFDLFSEWKGTWGISIGSGLVISMITLGVGIVFTYETVLLLSIVVIILSLNYNLSLLSASYTIGVTYVLFLLAPKVLSSLSSDAHYLFSNPNFTGLVILLGLFLIVESLLLRKTKRNDTYPYLELSNRGALIGSHHIKKMSLIPFFVLIPSGLITPIAPFWPYFSLGEETYSLLLVPFIVGFNYVVTGSLPQKAAHRLSKRLLVLGLIVLFIAAGSVYLPWLSLFAVIVAILGRELINYKFRVEDKQKVPYFTQMEKGLKVLSVIPGSPADELDVLVGEVVIKVNGYPINNVDQFYESLQKNAAYFKLDILNDAGEVRFVQGALYEEDHHELGLIFITNRYRSMKKEELKTV